MPFESKAQQRFMFSQKPELAKEFAKKTKNFKALPERADGSASDSALFKEDIPRKKVFGDVFMNKNELPPQKGRQLEAAEEGTLMGRLSSRMASRDMIDELDLGPKGRSPEAKQAQVADSLENTIPTKVVVGGLGRHFQTLDMKAFNMSDSIPTSKVREGSNMAAQAKNAGNVFNTMKKKETADTSDQIFNEGYKAGDKADTITMNMPLLTRLFEYAMEEKNFTDADLHRMLERIIAESKKSDVLTMSCYEKLVDRDTTVPED